MQVERHIVENTPNVQEETSKAQPFLNMPSDVSYRLRPFLYMSNPDKNLQLVRPSGNIKYLSFSASGTTKPQHAVR